MDCQAIVPSDPLDSPPTSMDNTLPSIKDGKKNDTHSHTSEESTGSNSEPCTLTSEQVTDHDELSIPTQDLTAPLGPDIREETTSVNGHKETGSKVNDIRSDKDEVSPSTETAKIDSEDDELNVTQSNDYNMKNGSLSDNEVNINDIHTSQDPPDDLLGPTLAPDPELVMPPSDTNPLNDEGVVNEPPRAAPGTAPIDPDVEDGRANGVSDDNGLSGKDSPIEGHSEEQMTVSLDKTINSKDIDNPVPPASSEMDIEIQSMSVITSTKAPLVSPTVDVVESVSTIDDSGLHHDDVITKDYPATTEPPHTTIDPHPTTQDVTDTLSKPTGRGISVGLNSSNPASDSPRQPLVPINVISLSSVESLDVTATPLPPSKQPSNDSLGSWNSNSSSVNASNLTSVNGTVIRNESFADPVVPATPTLVTNGNGVHMSQPREKEKSVFLRLSNQIKELEMNMSLFGSYLDQISTRYVR